MDIRQIISRLKSEDGQAGAWILKIFIVAAVIGIIISQCGPIIWNHVTIGSTADDAVNLAVQSFEKNNLNPGDTSQRMIEGMKKVTKEVEDWLAERDARLVGSINVAFNDAGKPYLAISIRKIVNTALFENVSYLSSYTEASAYREREMTP